MKLDERMTINTHNQSGTMFAWWGKFVRIDPHTESGWRVLLTSGAISIPDKQQYLLILGTGNTSQLWLKSTDAPRKRDRAYINADIIDSGDAGEDG